MRKTDRTRPLVVGLTGGVASGKSTVLAEFERRGAAVIDADRISREVVRPGTKAWRKIRKAFGEEALRPDGEIDRKKLGEAVFSSPVKRKLLEGITHPDILARIRQEIRKAR
ncbi:MAG: dephospho-CoA kinase, partial [Endomicrobiales bacterium]